MGLASGERVGRYEVVSALGAGGMGEVYRAHDPEIGRDVAIKMITADVAAEGERRGRFLREVRAAGALNHRNVLVVYDVGTWHEQPYLVTELLEGETIRQRLQDGALPRDQALEIAIQIAKGLAAIHARGIIHRDIKPSNLFLCRDGTVKILDFGVARQRAPDLTDTRSGALLGTPRYMAPEQVRGREVDRRADLFAFGAVLYEMVGGAPPFEGTSELEVAAAILEDDPPPLDDPLLGPVAERCLAKEPENRFPSAEAVLAALQGEPPPPVRRRRPRALGLILLAAAIGLGLGGIALMRSRDQHALANATPKPGPEPPGPKRPLPPLREKHLTLLPVDKNVLAAMVSPDGAVFAYSTADGLFIQNTKNGAPRRIKNASASLMNPLGFFPDGHRMLVEVVSGRTPSIQILDPLDNSFSPVRKRTEPWTLSPDGNLVPVETMPKSGDNKLMLLDLRDKSIRSIPALGTQPRRFDAHAWSPDSRRLALVQPWNQNGKRPVSLVVVPINGDKATVLPVEGELEQPGHCRAVGWIDDNHIMFGRARPDGSGSELREIGITDTGQWDGKPVRTLYEWSNACIEWPKLVHGRLFFVRSHAQTVVYQAPLAADGSLARPLKPIDEYGGIGWLRGWTPTGKLLFTSSRYGSRDIFEQSPDGKQASLLVGGPNDEIAPATSGNEVLFWRRTADHQCSLYALDHNTPRALSFTTKTTAFRGHCPHIACALDRPNRCILSRTEGSDQEVRAYTPPKDAPTQIISRFDPKGVEGEKLWSGPLLHAGASGVDVSRDGAFAVTGQLEPPGLLVIDLNSGEHELLKVGAEGGVSWATFRSDRPGIIYVPHTWTGYNVIWRLPDGTERPLSKLFLWSPHVSPDGKRLAGTLRANEANVWMLDGLGPRL